MSPEPLPSLAADLINHGLLDQQSRFLSQAKKIPRNPKIDQNNTSYLATVLRQIDWPSIEKVGDVASWAAWLIAQHADHDIGFQQYCLKLLTKSYHLGMVNPLNFAYLTDRCLVNDGQPQIYGTQWRSLNEVQPVSKPSKLDSLREKVGLLPFRYSLAARNQTISWEELNQLEPPAQFILGPFYCSRL